MGVQVEELTALYREWAMRLVTERWGSTRMVTRGSLYDLAAVPGFVALTGGSPVGLLTYRISGQGCEILSLDSTAEGQGVGTALLEAVRTAAANQGCRRLWLITTNDSMHALRFYQKRGFRLVTVYRNALDESRKLKPEIPRVGIDGIPLRDEIELEMVL